MIVVLVGTSSVAYAQSAGGAVYQWGRTENTITALSGLPADVVAVQAGNWGGMALDATGHVWDWGYGTDGELGDGAVTNSMDTAVEASGPQNIVSIGEGDDFAAAIDNAGDLWVWGDNLHGTLCVKNIAIVKTPVEISGLGATAVAGGGAHLMILLGDGKVEGCGDDRYGQLGNGKMADGYMAPVAVVGLTDVVAITAGNDFSAALEGDGSVWTWGYNKFGQLGDGTTKDEDLPVKVPLPLPAVDIYAGGDRTINGHMVALLSDGSTVAWGNDKWGQLGNGISGQSFSLPQSVDTPAGVSFSSVVAGGEDSFAVDTDGDLWAWGQDRSKELGVAVNGGMAVKPVLVGSGFTTLSATADEAIGLSSAP
jgi:alpha-tubulin suppressor-like RCC1 family protein